MEDLSVPPSTRAAAEARRRAVRVALHLGILLLTSGAQAQEAEAELREVLQALGLRGGEAIVTSSSVTVSYVAPGDAEATTAIQAARTWRHHFGQLAAAGALVAAIREGGMDIHQAELELDRIETMAPPYPHWLTFAAPALMAAAVTILFGGSTTDALATLGIVFVIQPAQERVERSSLPLFFQTVFGVSATVLLVVVLAALRLPIDASLVLTGGLLRFLPGAQLVAGMRDLIGRAIVPGTANLAEVLLLGVGIAASASLIMTLGSGLLGVDLRVSAEGTLEWPPAVTILAGAFAVGAYSIKLGVPRNALVSVVGLGALVALTMEDRLPILSEVSHEGLTVLGALITGIVGRSFALGRGLPPALWLVPAILPLLPAPATLLPLLAASEEARNALQSQAFATAFLIGVGVASGDILVSALQAHLARARGITT